MPTMKTTVVLWTVAAIFALACGRIEQAREMSEGRAGQAAAPAASPAASRDAFKASATFAASDSLSGAETVPMPDQTITPSMLIRTAQASVEVATLDTGVAGVRALALRVGGYVADVSVQDGHDQPHSATFEVRMPAARFDDALAALRPLGNVESVNVSTADVGEEYVDVNARMDNARKLEERLIGLLAARTGKLRDVLDVERELSRVREEIERYEGRLRYLRARGGEHDFGDGARAGTRGRRAGQRHRIGGGLSPGLAQLREFHRARHCGTGGAGAAGCAGHRRVVRCSAVAHEAAAARDAGACLSMARRTNGAALRRPWMSRILRGLQAAVGR